MLLINNNSIIELAIADDQIDNARSILLERAFKDHDPKYKFHDGRDIPLRESSEHLPGYCLESVLGNSNQLYLNPASFYHMDLGPESFSANTFIGPVFSFRLPKKLYK
jgi:hypothetical protein